MAGHKEHTTDKVLMCCCCCCYRVKGKTNTTEEGGPWARLIAGNCIIVVVIGNAIRLSLVRAERAGVKERERRVFKKVGFHPGSPSISSSLSSTLHSFLLVVLVLLALLSFSLRYIRPHSHSTRIQHTAVFILCTSLHASQKKRRVRMKPSIKEKQGDGF